MRCAKATWFIQLYIDQQLSLDQLRALEQHLSTCSACREELFLYEEIAHSLKTSALVAEPLDLTANIMQRVAWNTRQAQIEQQQRQEALATFRPSLRELLAAILLATFAMLGVILSDPSLRAVLPIANGHDVLSLFFIYLWSILLSINSNTLMLAFWVVGTFLGVWITLALAGAEMRSMWLRAVMERFPVW